MMGVSFLVFPSTNTDLQRKWSTSEEIFFLLFMLELYLIFRIRRRVFFSQVFTDDTTKFYSVFKTINMCIEMNLQGLHFFFFFFFRNGNCYIQTNKTTYMVFQTRQNTTAGQNNFLNMLVGILFVFLLIKMKKILQGIPSFHSLL